VGGIEIWCVWGVTIEFKNSEREREREREELKTRTTDLSMHRRAGVTPGAKHRLAAAMKRPTRPENTTSCRLSQRILLRVYVSSNLSMVACHRLSRQGNEPLIFDL